MVDTLVEALVQSGALRFGDFTLTSGKMSNYYVDLKAAFTNPGLLMRVAEELGPYTQGFQRMAGTELGAVPVLVALALETGLPYIILRKEAQAHGTGRAYEGEVVGAERILLVEDVTTTGGTLRRAAELLRGEGAVVDHAVCVVDRGEGATENLE
ncbi:MAG: orotate phosphoribosyltransferase, partial [Thermoplasmata archaeon]|nr:orotate phosphoribosyltransferase [Thermoplasmata archaeon]